MIPSVDNFRYYRQGALMHIRRAHEPLTVSIAIALVSLFGFVAAYLCVGIGLARLLRLYGQILLPAIGR